jgi:hypothetical protein
MPRVVTNSVLDMDMAQLGRGLARAWKWWTAELKAMVPARFKRPAVTAGLVAWTTAEGGLRFSERGHEVSAVAAHGRPAILAVSPAGCLQRTVTVPVMAEADACRAVLLDLDRLLPFPPETALIALGEDKPVGPEGRRITLAALPVAAAEAIVARAEEAGLKPAALALLDEAGAIRFDFLPVLARRRGLPDAHDERRVWWRIVIALFVVNLLLLVVADVRAVNGFAQLVDAHATLADQVRLKRRRLLDEQARRAALVAGRRAHDPLPMLADLGQALPAGVRVKRFEWAGDRGRLVGVADSGVDVAGALRRDARLRSVHATSVDMLARTPEGQPFDLSFERAR